ncbi:MAG: hypothetical protein HY271_04920 [Deltaproteobacteria bacterium]|nr:hypothetical protein [Deltaproteobacteria bacterium]
MSMKAPGKRHRGAALIVAAVVLWCFNNPATISSATDPTLDHFECYWITHNKTNIVVSLVSRFESSTATLAKAKRLCLPADQNGEDPSAPTHPEHLVSYLLRGVVDTTKFESVHVNVNNEFGTFGVQIVRSNFLLVPSSASLSSPPPPLSSSTLDTFECYAVKVGPRLLDGHVMIEDELGTHQEVIRKVHLLCVPVDENGGGVVNPAAALMCFKTKLPELLGPVFANNQFGSQTFQQLRHQTDLCVPSTIS